MSAENDFSVGSIPRHIIDLAIPMTLAQLVQMAYNLVDRIYIGHLPGTSSIALTGLGLTFPIITIIMAFTNLFSTGSVALYSIARGKQDEAAERRYMENAFLLLLLTSVVVMVLCFVFMHPILYLFGASDETYPYSAAYLRIYLIGTPLVMLATGMNGFINAQGYGKTGMFTILIGAVINIILDPIFIFVLDLGISGAAIATVISQLLSVIWVMAFLTSRRSLTPLRVRQARIDLTATKQITQLGVAGFVMQATNGIVQVAANNMLGIYGGDIYIGIMTVLNSVRDVVSLPLHGFTNAAQPVIGYNYGARKLDRIRQIIRFTTPVTVVYMALCWLIIFLLPQPIMHVFNSDPELLNKGTPAMHLFFFGFFFMAFQSVGQSTFVGLGKSKQATFFSLFRKVIIVVPLTIILPQIGGLGVMGVFLAEPISNFIGGLCCYCTMLWTVRHLSDRKQRSLA
ncbi:MAG: MATE family efflux transporter [Peptococcaceae bacterium]|nr:MATE family efflux transporter [Peptococcaceae bacterium]